MIIEGLGFRGGSNEQMRRMWLERENEKNVAETRNRCGRPSSPPWNYVAVPLLKKI